MTLKHAPSRCTIGELCDFESGNGFRPDDWASNGLPIIRIQNLNGSARFNYFAGEPDARWIVEPGDLLFAWAGVKGVSFGPTVWEGPRGVLNQHIYRIRPKRGVDKSWLRYALEQVTEQIESKAHGFKSTLVHVRKADITSAKTLLPCVNEQRSVAQAMSKWDVALATISKLHSLRAQTLSAMREQVLFASKLATPSQIHHLTRELSARNGTRLGRSSVMAVSKLSGMRPMREDTIASSIARYKIVPPLSFAYNPMRLNIGSIAMSPFDQDVLVSPDYVVFECDQSKLLPGYLNHARQSRRWAKFFGDAGNGSVRVRIYYDDLAAFRLPLPPLPEQRRITRALDAAAQEVETLRLYADALKRQKRGLMQKLLTGEWRLPATESTKTADA